MLFLLRNRVPISQRAPVAIRWLTSSRHVLNAVYSRSWEPNANLGRNRRINNRGSPRNSGYNGDKRVSDRDRRQDTVSFNKATFSKLIVVPKDGTDVAEVTLDSLFQDGSIAESLHKSISNMNFPGLTPVQQKTIKPILAENEKDFIARAKTGTGKTFAFLVPIFQHLINTKLENSKAVKAVIVAPTRDLAFQIQAEIEKIHKNNRILKKYPSICLVGGTNFGMSMRQMRHSNPNIVVATPGRLLDVLSRYARDYFRFVDFKVLDEADRLLEIGFKEDLEEISGILNSTNAIAKDHIRTLLFSATLDTKVQKLANDIMNKEECLFLDTVDPNEPEAHENIAQSLVKCENFAESMLAIIEHVNKKIAENPDYKAILFTPTVKFTSFFKRVIQSSLKNRRFSVNEFHGQLSQNQRTRLVNNFKRDRSGLLVCTDVGARGMDFPKVQEVLQIGVPSELANYVHRIGRTARAGTEGESVIFLTRDELPFINTLEEKKNITIGNQVEFEAGTGTSEKLEGSVARSIHDEKDVEDALISIIGFYRGTSKDYGIDPRHMLPNLAKVYGLLLGDVNKKIPVFSARQLEALGMINNKAALEVFDMDRALMDKMESKMSKDNGRSSNSRYRNNGPRREYGNRSYNNNNNNNNNNNYNSDYRRKRYDQRQGYNPRIDH